MVALAAANIQKHQQIARPHGTKHETLLTTVCILALTFRRARSSLQRSRVGHFRHNSFTARWFAAEIQPLVQPARKLLPCRIGADALIGNMSPYDGRMVKLLAIPSGRADKGSADLVPIWECDGHGAFFSFLKARWSWLCRHHFKTIIYAYDAVYIL